MLTEEQFIQELETRTGKKLGKDFGFILGTQHPYGESKPGMLSSGLINGYTVWRKEGSITLESTFISKGIEENIKILTQFLSRPMPIPGKDVKWVGEYDKTE